MKKTLFTLLIATCALTLGVADRARSEEDVWTLPPKPGGHEVEEFLSMLAGATDRAFLFDPQSPQIARKKIEFAGAQEVPRDRLFSWGRSVLRFHRLILVPVGPSDGNLYMVVDANSPQVTQRPVFVPEGDLHEWADEDGAYITTTITLEHLTDTSRARNALAQLCTRTVGRVNDVPDARSFVVTDFAPVVCAMEEALRRMDEKAAEIPLPDPRTKSRRASPGSSAPVPPDRIDRVGRYEEMLTP